MGKEVHFFDGGLLPGVDNYQKGEKWYRAHFPLKTHPNASFYKAYEASPLYIFNPLAPERIRKLVPNTKVIALLRNPTERAISHYFHEKRKGRETLPIMEALQREEERLAPVVARKDYKNNLFIHCSYKSRGRYKEQLERYGKHFSNEQVLIIASEELFRTPEKTLKMVFEFIGVNPNLSIPDLRPRNVSHNKMGIEAAVFEYLNDYFLPYNRELYEFIQREYDW